MTNQTTKPAAPFLGNVLPMVLSPQALSFGANVMTVEARFWAKVDKRGPHECWPWKAARCGNGYGGFRGGERWGRAHRFAYQLCVGPIRPEFCVCHHCDNRLCVNPAHLFLGTQADNIHDAQIKGRMAHGARQGASRLTNERVREIRDAYGNGNISQRALAKRYGVAQKTIGSIVLRRTWRHIA